MRGPLILRTSHKLLNLLNNINIFLPQLGCTHAIKRWKSLRKKKLIEIAQNDRIIAIGETGLDYFRVEGQDMTWQRDRFRTHINAAKEVKKPLIIHTRNAATDTMNILKEEGADQCKGVMHCFAEDWEVAKKALDLGFYISFSGIVTFKSAQNVQEVAQKTPIDRILVETDAPYLAPVPHRGKTNEPALVRHTAQFVADLRGISLEKLAENTTENFFNLFPATTCALTIHHLYFLMGFRKR